MKEIQVEFISGNIFVNVDSNSSKINNVLNPSSIAAYQQSEAFSSVEAHANFKQGVLVRSW